METALELLIENKHITGLQADWIFDEFYRSTFLPQADLNDDGKLTKDELDLVVQQVFMEGERDLYPFMYMATQNTPQPFTLQQPEITFTDNQLHYRFQVKFEDPQPLAGQHTFGMYDPEYYVDFEQDLILKLPEDLSCTQDLAENPSISIYMGLIHPETYTLTCS